MGEDPRDSFSEACGLVGPLKVRLENPAREVASEFEFRRPFLVIGRDDSADLAIDSPAVSRRHAYFQVVAGRVFCIDLWSRTGVHWADGERTVGWVDRGQGIDIGPERIYFDWDGAGSGGDGAGSAGQGGNLPISRAFEWPTVTDARLEFLGAEVHREPWQVSRSLALLGRSPICRVRLEGPEIANIHVALVRTPAGIWVVDLLGREVRLRVGGATTRFARLEDGDEIGLGSYQMRVRIGQAALPSGRSELARRPQGEGARPARVDVGPSTGVGPRVGGRGPRDRGPERFPGPGHRAVVRAVRPDASGDDRAIPPGDPDDVPDAPGPDGADPRPAVEARPARRGAEVAPCGDGPS